LHRACKNNVRPERFGNAELVAGMGAEGFG
jgi:hypothetical protein